jgi:hypothetical protein
VKGTPRACLASGAGNKPGGFILKYLTGLLALCLVLFATSGVPVSAGQTPLPWVARHGLSAADYQKAFDQFGKDFELTSVSAYLDKGQLRYAALWRHPAKAEPWAARHGLSAADFTKAIADLAKDGLSLVYVDGYEVNGTPLFAGIWRKTSGGTPVVKLAMDSSQYQAEFDANGKAGMRLEHVAGYAQRRGRLRGDLGQGERAGLGRASRPHGPPIPAGVR